MPLTGIFIYRFLYPSNIPPRISLYVIAQYRVSRLIESGRSARMILGAPMSRVRISRTSARYHQYHDSDGAIGSVGFKLRLPGVRFTWKCKLVVKLCRVYITCVHYPPVRPNRHVHPSTVAHRYPYHIPIHRSGF